MYRYGLGHKGLFDHPLLQQNIAHLPQLRAGTHEVEALHGEVVGLELGVGRAVRHDPGLKPGGLAETVHHFGPGLLQVALGDDAGEILFEPFQHHVIAIELALGEIEDVVGLGVDEGARFLRDVTVDQGR